MTLPQKCRPVLANIYRAALSAFCQLTHGSIKGFSSTDRVTYSGRREGLQERRRDAGREEGGGVADEKGEMQEERRDAGGEGGINN